MLGRIGGEGDPEFVDWLAVERIDGREYDVAIHRRWLDPTKPLAAAVLRQADGVLVTSATLRAGEGWTAAEARTGAVHLPAPAGHFEAESPFDYAASSEVLIVTDVRPGDIASLAGAYARLIEAAGGGTLGLFTAIARLKGVHARIADRLARAGLPLLAQHVDPIDAGTLVDIFRDDPRASLLGTDALRDGVDVPGESLRLVVMERVPWPRPTVLHAARRMAGGGSAYDDRVVRARLAQAFGRLIRRDGDKGLFVILSAAMPSRLLTAFPPGVPVRRVPLDQAIARVAERLWRTEAARRCRGGRMKWLTILRHAKSSWDEPARRLRPAAERAWPQGGDGGRRGAEAARREIRLRDRQPGQAGPRNARPVGEGLWRAAGRAFRRRELIRPRRKICSIWCAASRTTSARR